MAKRKEKPKANPFACPDHLDQVAREEWNSICKALEGIDLLNAADRSALELYCVTFSGWRNAVEMVNRHGAVIQIKTSAGAFPKRNPFDVIRERNAALCARLLRDFGLTPTSKNRPEITPEGTESIEQKRERILRLYGS